MMFFLIGGVQPRTVTLDSDPRTCDHCGQPSLRLRRTDHYLSLFFIPLLPIKKGKPFLECGRCGSVFTQEGTVLSAHDPSPQATCPDCGRSVQPDFKLCPYCGRSLRSF